MLTQGRRAVVTGVTGQDGAYLSQLLLEKGYIVFGTYRRTSSVNFWRLAELGVADAKPFPVEYDLQTCRRQSDCLRRRCTEIYNLAAQSFVGIPLNSPLPPLKSPVLVRQSVEAIRTVDTSIRFYQASTSEMFGKVKAVPQSKARPSPAQPLWCCCFCSLVHHQLPRVL